jgi:hypothetical protein
MDIDHWIPFHDVLEVTHSTLKLSHPMISLSSFHDLSSIPRVLDNLSIIVKLNHYQEPLVAYGLIAHATPSPMAGFEGPCCMLK